VDYIRHGEILKKLMPGAVLVTGRDTKKVRKIVMDTLNGGCINPVITTLYGEGVDIMPLNAVTIAGGGMSSIETFQRLRSITPGPGKDRGVVVDFMDNVHFLRAHSNARKKFYGTEPEFRLFDVDVRKMTIDQVRNGTAS